jgi:PKD repeat protein
LVKRTALAIAMCAVMVLVAAVPVIADSHYIQKGDKGPSNSAVTWEYTPTGYGVWTGHVNNSGLRSIVVDVDDNSAGMMVNILHQRIRFAAYDLYPSGEMDTTSAILAAGHTYTITITPNGPKGSSCTVEDMFDPADPPVAVISADMTYMSVAVNGSLSYDPDGTIEAYDWSFGDGAQATGQTATHTYALEGQYLITLIVTDNDGLTGKATKTVNAILPGGKAPVADFTVTPNKLSVVVNASLSVDPDPDGAIVSYEWNFGDGAVATGVVATHTYATWGTWWITLKVTDNDGMTGSASTQVTVSDPPQPMPPPYTVFGYVTDASSNMVFGASVVVTDVRTGAIWAAVTDYVYGYYMVDLTTNMTGYAAGDTIVVSATTGLLSGTASGVVLAPGNEAYMWLDVVVLP